MMGLLHGTRLGRTLLLLLTGALLLAWSSAPSVSAQEPGVNFDPDSPAGKEYALPIDAARDDASGGDRDRSGSSPRASPRTPGSPAPLFGAGISPSESVGAVAGAEVAEATLALEPPADRNRAGGIGVPASGAPPAGLSSDDVPSAAGSSSNALVAWLVPLALVLLVLSPTLIVGARMARDARDRNSSVDQ